MSNSCQYSFEENSSRCCNPRMLISKLFICRVWEQKAQAAFTEFHGRRSKRPCTCILWGKDGSQTAVSRELRLFTLSKHSPSLMSSRVFLRKVSGKDLQGYSSQPTYSCVLASHRSTVQNFVEIHEMTKHPLPVLGNRVICSKCRLALKSLWSWGWPWTSGLSASDSQVLEP